MQDVDDQSARSPARRGWYWRDHTDFGLFGTTGRCERAILTTGLVRDGVVRCSLRTVPQLVNLNTWPATVFIGHDGRVRAVHSGFASPASGEFNRQLKEEFTSRIEQLLAEQATENNVAAATTSSTASAGS